MKSFLKHIAIFTASIVTAMSLSLAFAAPVGAQTSAAKQAVCGGVNTTGGTCNNNGSELSNVVKLVIRVLSTIAGVAAVIMLIVGGLKYITSGGDSSKVSSAKSTIIYALVGLVVVAIAQFAVRFVFQESTKG
jgi:hypothetical protein